MLKELLYFLEVPESTFCSPGGEMAVGGGIEKRAKEESTFFAGTVAEGRR